MQKNQPYMSLFSFLMSHMMFYWLFLVWYSNAKQEDQCNDSTDSPGRRCLSVLCSFCKRLIVQSVVMIRVTLIQTFQIVGGDKRQKKKIQEIFFKWIHSSAIMLYIWGAANYNWVFAPIMSRVTWWKKCSNSF